MKGLVLLAHGSRDPVWGQTLSQVRDWVQAARPDCRVEAAYLELAEPRLADCLAQLHHAGCGEITVLPLLVARGHHLSVELPGLLNDAQLRHPGLLLSLSPHLGADAAIVDLVLTRAAQAQPLAQEVLLP
jgi:sirohydrochlorin cobaltochelatase